METFLVRALQLVLSLSLLVIVHEFGHFLFARLFKVRVERFSIFFSPWFSLFKHKPKNSDTEFVLGWLPLGGYVKIAGMIDESMDTEQMKKPAQPWEFRAKPAWQRLLIMVAGVVFNFLLALFIYAMILFTWGDSFIEVQKAELGMVFNESAKSVGFRDGDVLLSADGVEFTRYDGELISRIVDAREVSVKRDGVKTSIYIPENFMQLLLADSVRFADFRVPYVVDRVIADSPAEVAGLQPGDSIIALNGKPIAFNDFVQIMADRRLQADSLLAAGLNPREISLTLIRNHEQREVGLQVDEDFKMGVYTPGDVKKLFPVVQEEYTFLGSIPAGAALGVKTLKGYVNNMKHLFSKEGAKQLGGFGTIGSIFPATWNWYQFWYMTAFLSIILAFMNILPIPALDGGHVLFLLYEIIARRKPSDRFMEYAQVTGMLLLFILLIWANFNDVLRFLF